MVYWLGFFSEICVPIYSICAGYGQQVSIEAGKTEYKENINRIIKLLVNYWVVLVLFSVLGLIFKPHGNIPGTFLDFVKAIFLLHSYNGAWWYLNTYIILMLIAPFIIKVISFIKEIKLGILVCFGFQVFWYAIVRVGIWPELVNINFFIDFIFKEITNLCSVLPYFCIGVFLCKGKIIDNLDEKIQSNCSIKRNALLLMCLTVIFILTNIFHKAVLIGVIGLISFLIFNLIKKSDFIERMFLFLGKHSTNIWLTHMFFYAYIFDGFIEIVKYPVFMLALMLVLCIMTSYVIEYIKRIILFVGKRNTYEDKNNYMS